MLAGMIAGFAAQGIKPEWPAVLGVYLHGMAADACASAPLPIRHAAQ